MGIFDFIFGSKNKLPFSKTVSFERIESDFKLDIGDQVNLWNKPNTNLINLYAKGSAAGNGLVGVTSNSIISKHLSKTKFLLVENEIVGLTSNRIDLFVKLYTVEKVFIENSTKQRSVWLENMQKKYNPKANWEVRFFSESEIQKDNLQIKTISKDQIGEFYEKQEEMIWLTDNIGLKLNAENRIRQGGTEKTLRAVFTGHILEIKEFKKDDYWYYLMVGIKNNAT